MNNKTDARLFILNGGIQRKIHDKLKIVIFIQVKHRDVKKIKRIFIEPSAPEKGLVNLKGKFSDGITI